MRQSKLKQIRMHKSFVESNEIQQLQLQLRKHPQSTPIQRLCSVCCEKYIHSYSKSLFTCNHNQMCLGCLHDYCSHSVTQKNIPKCVSPKCCGSINIRDEVAISQLTISLRIKLKEIYKELKNNKKCTKPDCFGFINNGTCDLCLNNFCENCWNVQHRGDCQNPQIELPPGIKLCPKCGSGIEKDGGCLHIECAECKYNFCFKCLKIWSVRHHATCGTGDTSVWQWIFGRKS